MLLQMKDINKKFGEMYALKDVSIDIVPGEFHALVGENGAGKSTLIKILTGVYSLTSGEIVWEGNAVQINNPRESQSLGIHVLHQDRHLIPSFTVVENVYLGLDYPQRGPRVDWQTMNKRVTTLMDDLNIHIPLNIPAERLSPPQRTQVEILRAMMTDCKLLVLDEPTASLTDQESEQLFSIIATLKAKGTSILYVSHRMDEVMRLSDRITILKNGMFVSTCQKEETTKDGIVALMTDQWERKRTEDEEEKSFGAPVLEVKHLASLDGVVKDVSFTVHKGEILGVFGLGGSGRTQTIECTYGSRPLIGGEIELYGEPYDNPSPRRSVDAGMTLVSEDRRGEALITSLSVQENTVLSVIDSYSHGGIVDDKSQQKDTLEMIKTLAIKTTGPQQVVGELSGGNQQKVAFAKALMPKPRIILCDEPTQAVDVKTRYEIHMLLKDMAKEGAAIVFISSDLKEVLEVADNIQVIASGYSRERFINDGLSAETVLAACYAE